MSAVFADVTSELGVVAGLAATWAGGWLGTGFRGAVTTFSTVGWQVGTLL